MAIKKTIDQALEPSGKPSTLKHEAASEFPFEAEGKTQVSVRIAKGFKAASKPVGDDLVADKGFTPVRIVINLLIKTESEAAATRFSTPFELRIRFTADDVSQAGGKESLKLAYWSDHRWNVLTSSDHKFQIESDDTLFAELSSWPEDPPIAVGF